MATSQYLYGITLTSRTEEPSGDGVQGRPIRTVDFGGICAVVSELESADSLGTPEDLLAHVAVLDSISARDPILPMAFGTVVPDETAIAADILEPREEEYFDALHQVAGHSQYTLTVRFDQDAALREIIAHNSEADALRAAIAGTSEDQTRQQRIRLGEIIVKSLESRRPSEAASVLDQLSGPTRRVAVRDVGQADVVLEAAVLVKYDEVDTFESAMEQLARTNHGRLKFRLVGPQAPYDFVPEL